jgi:hypothetical protein
MVLNVEYSVSPVSVPTASGSEVPVGFIDYPIVVTNDLKIARESHYTYIAGLLIHMKYRILPKPPRGLESYTVHRVGVGILCRRNEGPRCEARRSHPPGLDATLRSCKKAEVRLQSSFPDSTVLMIYGQEILYTGYIDKRLRMAFSCT